MNNTTDSHESDEPAKPDEGRRGRASGPPSLRSKSHNAFHVVWKNTGKLTKWIQVIALLFAAIWTYLHFSETEAPSLQTPVGISGNLESHWSTAPPTGNCTINAVFAVMNQGVGSFDVGRVTVRAWRIPLPSQASGFRYLDVTALEKSVLPITTLTIDSPKDSRLIGHFAPKTDLYSGFTWTFFGPGSDDLFVSSIDVYTKPKRFLGVTYGSSEWLGSASVWNPGICSPNQH